MKPEAFKEIKKFVDWSSDFLKLQIQPTIVPQTSRNFAASEKSFGGYQPAEKKIYISVVNRNLADILRSLAHELVHAKQDEEGRIGEKSGKTGSEEENQANAVAGVIMRKYGQENPAIFDEFLLEDATAVDGEAGELERVQKEEGISKMELLTAFEDADIVQLNDAVWSQLENTDSYEIVGRNQAEEFADDYGKDWKPIEQAIKTGQKLPPPLILKYGDRFILVGGNTRLMFYRAYKIYPKVLLGIIPEVRRTR